MLNIAKLKQRLHTLSNSNNKSNLTWKPKPGQQVVRIVPYKFHTDGSSFIELKFHYNVNGKTYLSPDSFGRPDPIVEWSNRMKRTGVKDDWQLGKKMEPKLRTYAPVLVRGEEDQGVRFWGFGKQVYEELIKVIADDDFGDITDVEKGHDILVEFKAADETGKSFPETSIRVKPKPSIAIDASKKHILDNQTDILELFPEYTYDELKDIMDKWLAPESPEPGDESPSAVVAGANVPDADPTKQFDELFAGKN